MKKSLFLALLSISMLVAGCGGVKPTEEPINNESNSQDNTGSEEKPDPVDPNTEDPNQGEDPNGGEDPNQGGNPGTEPGGETEPVTPPTPKTKAEKMYENLDNFFEMLKNKNFTMSEDYEYFYPQTGQSRHFKEVKKYMGDVAFESGVRNCVKTEQGIFLYDITPEEEISIRSLYSPNVDLEIYEYLAPNIFGFEDFAKENFILSADQTWFFVENFDVISKVFPISTPLQFHTEYVVTDTASLGIGFDDDGSAIVTVSAQLALPQLDEIYLTDAYTSVFTFSDIGTTTSKVLEELEKGTLKREQPSSYPMMDLVDKAFTNHPVIPFVDGFGYGLEASVNDQDYSVTFKDLTANSKVIGEILEGIKDSEWVFNENYSEVDVEWHDYDLYVYTAPFYYNGKLEEESETTLEFYYVPYDQLRETDRIFYPNGIFEMRISVQQKFNVMTDRAEINKYMEDVFGANWFSFPTWGNAKALFIDDTANYAQYDLFLFYGLLRLVGLTETQGNGYLAKVRKQLLEDKNLEWKDLAKEEYEAEKAASESPEDFPEYVEDLSKLEYFAIVGYEENTPIYLVLEGYFENGNVTIEVRWQVAYELEEEE